MRTAQEMPVPSEQTFVQVVVHVGAPTLHQPFTYRVPSGLGLSVGDCILAPFGAREVIGYVVGVSDDCAADILHKIKDIAGKIDNANGFDPALWNVAHWVQEQTLSDAESCLRLIAPDIASARMRTDIHLADEKYADVDLSPEAVAVLEKLKAAPDHTAVQSSFGRSADTAKALTYLRKRGVIERSMSIEPPRAREKTVRLVRLNVEPEVAASEAARLEKGRSVKQARLLRELVASASESAGRSVPSAGLTIGAEARVSAKALADKGLVAYHEMSVRRDPFDRLQPLRRTKSPALTDEQSHAAIQIGAAIETGAFASFLIHGVTGSGKTEVYMDAIARVRAQNRGAIVLLPEISLSAQVMDVMKARFGDQVAVLHSALTTGEWFDEWQRIKRGDAMVVVGARSAIFAPIPNLGLVVVDEEHDGAYKQDSSPRYNARDVAMYRAKQANAVCVFGSATPSVESYYRATIGIHTLLTLKHRVLSRPLPGVRIVDLRNAKRVHPDELDEPIQMPPEVRGIISRPLLDAIAQRLAKREQTILFLNRRGFAQFLLCRDCGFTFRCPNCAVSLTFHRFSDMLQCHHCDFRRAAPEHCPKCNGANLRPFGIGTEKVEEAVKLAFPNVRTLRMDRDTVTKKGSHSEILRSFRNGDADILIGTQMVAKGLDFASVTLVGVINADTALNLPDFRASERSFQLLAQVSGRAGRGESPGEVMVQTFNPDHESIVLASDHDYESFYAAEIADRRELCYPPFSHLANIVIADEVEKHAVERIHEIARRLRDVTALYIRRAKHSPNGEEPARIDILGPVACPLERLRNKYRWHVLVRSVKRPVLRGILRETLAQIPTNERSGLTLDIDPISML